MSSAHNSISSEEGGIESTTTCDEYSDNVTSSNQTTDSWYAEDSINSKSCSKKRLFSLRSKKSASKTSFKMHDRDKDISAESNKNNSNKLLMTMPPSADVNYDPPCIVGGGNTTIVMSPSEPQHMRHPELYQRRWEPSPRPQMAQAGMNSTTGIIVQELLEQTRHSLSVMKTDLTKSWNKEIQSLRNMFQNSINNFNNNFCSKDELLELEACLDRIRNQMLPLYDMFNNTEQKYTLLRELVEKVKENLTTRESLIHKSVLDMVDKRNTDLILKIQSIERELTDRCTAISKDASELLSHYAQKLGGFENELVRLNVVHVRKLEEEVKMLCNDQINCIKETVNSIIHQFNTTLDTKDREIRRDLTKTMNEKFEEMYTIKSGNEDLREITRQINLLNNSVVQIKSYLHGTVDKQIKKLQSTISECRDEGIDTVKQVVKTYKRMDSEFVPRLIETEKLLENIHCNKNCQNMELEHAKTEVMELRKRQEEVVAEHSNLSKNIKDRIDFLFQEVNQLGQEVDKSQVEILKLNKNVEKFRNDSNFSIKTLEKSLIASVLEETRGVNDQVLNQNTKIKEEFVRLEQFTLPEINSLIGVLNNDVKSLVNDVNKLMCDRQEVLDQPLTMKVKSVEAFEDREDESVGEYKQLDMKLAVELIRGFENSIEGKMQVLLGQIDKRLEPLQDKIDIYETKLQNIRKMQLINRREKSTPVQTGFAFHNYRPHDSMRLNSRRSNKRHGNQSCFSIACKREQNTPDDGGKRTRKLTIFPRQDSIREMKEWRRNHCPELSRSSKEVPDPMEQDRMKSCPELPNFCQFISYSDSCIVRILRENDVKVPLDSELSKSFHLLFDEIVPPDTPRTFNEETVDLTNIVKLLTEKVKELELQISELKDNTKKDPPVSPSSPYNRMFKSNKPEDGYKGFPTRGFKYSPDDPERPRTKLKREDSMGMSVNQFDYINPQLEKLEREMKTLKLVDLPRIEEGVRTVTSQVSAVQCDKEAILDILRENLEQEIKELVTREIASELRSQGKETVNNESACQSEVEN